MIVILMVIGILFIVAYAVNKSIVDYIIGVAFLLIGLGLIIFSIVRTGKLLTVGSIIGILALSAGIYEFVSTSLGGAIAGIISWFIFIIGIILFLVGIIMICLNSKKNLISGIIEIAGGAVLATLGGLMLFPLNKPVLGSDFIWLIAGIVIILLSILMVLNLFFPSLFSTKVAKTTKIED